ncbi:MAG: metal-dependent hydrolase [Rickettsiales bacterium]|jgi:L-ascorbate metabolism protein UlaG (beta-lactamase superfamily)|nr:metal-dependent hydrolase [Rickettsiales bacterium]
MPNKLDYNGVELTYLSHSGFIIGYGGKRLAIDPFLTYNPYAKASPADIKVDDVVITHAHFDHIGDAVEIARSNKCRITACFGVSDYFSRQGMETSAIPLGGTLPADGPKGTGWFTAHFRAAMHNGESPDKITFAAASSILLGFGDVKIYHLGDTALHYDFKLVGEIYKPDIALIPIGGVPTMDIDEAVIATGWLAPKIAVPIHYNTFPHIKANPFEFKDKAEKALPVKCVVLEP